MQFGGRRLFEVKAPLVPAGVGVCWGSGLSVDGRGVGFQSADGGRFVGDRGNSLVHGGGASFCDRPAGHFGRLDLSGSALRRSGTFSSAVG